MSEPSCSVVICVYERPQFLTWTLLSYLRQTRTDFEVVVADDGSGPAVREAIERLRPSLPFEVRHVWQEDRGFRRAAAINLGIRAAASDYVIFSDSDCLPMPDWVEQHLARRCANRMLIGGVVLLTEEECETADDDWIRAGAYEALLTSARRRKLLKAHLKNRWQILIRRKRRPHNLGGNMSLWKRDLERVNGYDENYEGWGNEDGDVRERLKRIGVWPKSIAADVPILHLWHPFHSSKKDMGRNRAYSRRPDIPIWAENGLYGPDEPLPDGIERPPH